MKTIIREYELEEDINGELCIFGDLLNEYEIEDDLTLFVYDDCHKIYIVEDKEDIESVKKMWGEKTIFYNIDELPKIWEETCPLRFISNWKLDKQFVRQFKGAKFEFID